MAYEIFSRFDNKKARGKINNKENSREPNIFLHREHLILIDSYSKPIGFRLYLRIKKSFVIKPGKLNLSQDRKRISCILRISQVEILMARFGTNCET